MPEPSSRSTPFQVLVALGAMAFALGCDTPITDTGVPPGETGADAQPGQPTTDLDRRLRNALLIQAKGGGFDAFKLPQSNQLSRIPQDPKNPLTPAKVALGQMLFHETALGVDNVRPEGRETYACASCHVAPAGFTANLPMGIAEGGSGFGVGGEGRVLLAQYNSNPDKPDVLPIRVPTNMNGAFQQVLLWNGQFGGVGPNLGTEARWTVGTPVESNLLGLHGLETQAHAGLKVHRMESIKASRVASMPEYRRMFAAAFPGDPDPITRLNAALAIAAFERTMLANRAPYQRWLWGDAGALTDQEKRGALLFFTKANCVACHTGPALNSMSFHALGMNDLDGAVDPSRVHLAAFEGTVPDATRLGRGGFTGRDEDNYKFKTPQLYNTADIAFLGHGSSFSSIREVVEYKNTAVRQNPRVPVDRLDPLFVPLKLNPQEINDLVAFLTGGLYDSDLARYVPYAMPSGNCTPMNDPQARLDLGCGLVASN